MPYISSGSARSSRHDVRLPRVKTQIAIPPSGIATDLNMTRRIKGLPLAIGNDGILGNHATSKFRTAVPSRLRKMFGPVQCIVRWLCQGIFLVPPRRQHLFGRTCRRVTSGTGIEGQVFARPVVTVVVGHGTRVPRGKRFGPRLRGRG